jgi:hypothetical protein
MLLLLWCTFAFRLRQSLAHTLRLLLLLLLGRTGRCRLAGPLLLLLLLLLAWSSWCRKLSAASGSW